MFTGPSKPTPEQLRDTPLLVRRAVVKKALEWLKLNHKDYQDIVISEENLSSYDAESVPVPYEYHQQEYNKDALTSAINEEVEDEGTETGPCPVSVHGLTGEDFGNMTSQEMRAAAMKHLKENKKNILFVAHDEAPVPTFHNPSLFPMMYPHLFPYGLGGIGNSMQTAKIGQTAHKKFYLMYHDKRFQLEPSFSIIAFNVEQMKQSNDGGFIITHRRNISEIADRICKIDMYNRFKNKERVVPANDQEKACLQLINDVDAGASRVQGSVTSKKHMRNEVWSLINKIGSPSWFITVSPADVNHPICLYFADTDHVYKPEIQDKKIREQLIKQNPVAAARFFDFMVRAFIKHVLGVGSEQEGLYGKTEAYYGTVEQQGRLTLQLDLLLWITSSLSPQEIRDKIMKHDSEFIQSLISYLESCYVGQFETGTSAEVNEQIVLNKTKADYKDPTLTMPTPPPPDLCSCSNLRECKSCLRVSEWQAKYNQECDDLAFRSNMHSCRTASKNKKVMVPVLFTQSRMSGGCLNHNSNSWLTFNLRYECNDACDDYTALRKRGQPSASNGPGFDIDELDDSSMHDFLSKVNDAYNQDSVDAMVDFNTEDLLPNNSTIRNQLLNEQITRTLDSSGILDVHSEKYKLDADVAHFNPDMTIDSGSWKQKVAEERSKALLRMKNNDQSDNGESKDQKDDKDFKNDIAKEQKLSEKIVSDETLNKEKTRAFKIITNHSSSAEFKPLRMYLGGMGGTGTAAALVHGQTYHSLLGFSRPSTEEVSVNEDTGIKKARDNLDGVKYIFIDEISGNNDSGFGGYSVIFAGDFAQLPPVGGTALYTKKAAKIDRAHSFYTQAEEMGKAIWHQVTHAVILRKNMRQQAQSLDDTRLHSALENMRFASCEPDDIAYLHSRVAGRLSTQPKINDVDFCYVSIITSRNTQRDCINKVQSQRFATEVKQPLPSFYCWDVVGHGKDPATTRRKAYRKATAHKTMTSTLREALWDLAPSDTGHLPGILQLCIDKKLRYMDGKQ
ncbi:hypothetical protein D9758_009372 [Tetrapyrgos nigripes]|uniref:ATP-dependent DNA helicase n=1 Tax=Tetrapyrgos nigripes TaxID=182062 RepID=A0A8H5D2M8_9AGAR|nr:hypothetical protein D9758_009372 [Tetrapyrgos nigripes]